MDQELVSAFAKSMTSFAESQLESFKENLTWECIKELENFLSSKLGRRQSVSAETHIARYELAKVVANQDELKRRLDSLETRLISAIEREDLEESINDATNQISDKLEDRFGRLENRLANFEKSLTSKSSTMMFNGGIDIGNAVTKIEKKILKSHEDNFSRINERISELKSDVTSLAAACINIPDEELIAKFRSGLLNVYALEIATN